MPKAQETVIEIDLAALEHNFKFLKSKLNKQTKFLAVVKASGYGSDASIVAKYLEQLDVDYFAVAYTQEGIVLRDAGIKTPILVLHPQTVNFETLVDHCLEPNLYNAHILNEFLIIAQKKNLVDYPIHIKFNTGLNRLGFSENEIDFIIDQLSKIQSR